MIKALNFDLFLRWVLLASILSVGQPLPAQSQQVLTLEECQEKAQTNFPLVKQHDLIGKSEGFSLLTASRGNLPQVIVSGQATYQSEVTSVPFSMPGSTIETISKDQYKLYAEISQSLTDGLTIRKQKELITANSNAEEQKLEVELYKIRDRVNQLYFGLLLIDAQIHQNTLLRQDIQAGIRKMTAAVENGIAFKSSLDQLKAESLRVAQRTIELKATRKGYSDMLAMFINQPLDEYTILQKPESEPVLFEISRPELALYDFQKRALDVQSGLTGTRSLPRVNLFFQGGHGRPALNFLDNDFKTYYLTGLRFSWNLSSFYTNGKEKELITLNQTTLDVQRETFLFNTRIQLSQQQNELNKYEELIQTDREIIELRTSIKQTASDQLEQGAITATDYLSYVIAEDQARQNELVHQIQWLLAQQNFQTISGIN